jgi:hypothetical protein
MPRLSLTQRQRETEAGAELLNLIQTVTEDGHLSDEEVEQLRDWLRANEDAELPARDHLHAMVEQVLRDGQVTDNERRELYRALETVLPPDLRPIAKLRRQEREAEDRERRKDEKARDRERNTPIARFNFMVAGVRHEGRAAIVARYVLPAHRAHLRRDPTNPHSRNAIEVRTADGHMVGYVPEDDARDLAPLLDAGAMYYADFTKILGRRQVPIPVVDCHLFPDGATQKGLTRHPPVPGGSPTPGRPAPAKAAPTRTEPAPSIAGSSGAMPPLKPIVAVVVALVLLAILLLLL